MRTPRSDFTLEFKKEAVRLVRSGPRQSEVSASLGISGQTLHNWVKADTAGRLSERAGVKAVSEEQMEICRLKAELTRTRMERDLPQKKRRRISPWRPGEIRLHRPAQEDLAGRRSVSRAGGRGERLPDVAETPIRHASGHVRQAHVRSGAPDPYPRRIRGQ